MICVSKFIVAMPTDSQDKLAHCRGIRRMHLRSNAPACEQAPDSHIRFICAWLIATRKISVFYYTLNIYDGVAEPLK